MADLKNTNEQVKVQHLNKQISLEDFNKIPDKQIARDLNINLEQVSEVKQAVEFLTQDSAKAVEMLNVEKVTITVKKTRTRKNATVHHIGNYLKGLEDGATFSKQDCIDVADTQYFGELPTLTAFNNASGMMQQVYAKKADLTVEELSAKIKETYLKFIKRVNSALSCNGDSGCVRTNTAFMEELQITKTAQGVYMVIKPSNPKFAELKAKADEKVATRNQQLADAKAKAEAKAKAKAKAKAEVKETK